MITTRNGPTASVAGTRPAAYPHHAASAKVVLVRTLFLAVLAIPFVLAGCASKPAEAPVGVSPPHKGPTAHAIDLEPSLPYTPLAASLLAKLPEGSFGPYLSARQDGAMVVLATPIEGEALAWMSSPLGADGVPNGKMARLGPTPSGIQSTSLRPLGESGYVLLWSRSSDRGQLVEAMALGDDGASRGPATAIYQGADVVLWADAVTTAKGAHVYIATSNGRESRVQVIALDAKGAAPGGLQLAAATALAWQPVATPQGSMLATVQLKDAGDPYGKVMATPVGADGHPGAPEIVAPSGADLDLDSVVLANRVVLGFTDHSGGDGRVHLLSLDFTGKPLAAPRSPLMSAGDQALLGLSISSGRDPSLLITWEDLASRGLGKRRVQLSTFGSDATTPKGRAMLEMATRDESLPAVSGAVDGFATVSLARACLGSAATCEGAQVVPTYVRYANDLSVIEASPLLLQPLDGQPPDSVWGLSCASKGCFTIATDSATPTGAYVASLAVARDAWRAPAARSTTGTGASLESVTTLLRGPRLGAISGARVGAGDVIASVTDFAEGSTPPPIPPDVDARAEAEKDRMAQKDPKHATPRGAIVSVTSVDAKGDAKTATLSVRGLSPGGVAIAGDTSGKEACIAWVARDAGDPELFLTRVGDGGKKLAQQMITHAKGDVTDVAIAAADDGWIVAWVDGRDGDGEVYAVRIDRNLRKKGPEQRITQAKGDASEVVLLVVGNEARIGFVDPRASDKSSAADVYLARVKLADATKIGGEIRISSGQHAPHALRIVPASDGVMLAWLDGDASATDRGVTMQTVMIDGAGAARSLPTAVSLGELSPTSIALSCEKERCRLIATHADGESTSLADATFRQGETPVLHDLVSLFARPGVDVSPTLLGSTLYVADENGSREGRLRKLAIRWP